MNRQYILGCNMDTQYEVLIVDRAMSLNGTVKESNRPLCYSSNPTSKDHLASSWIVFEIDNSGQVIRVGQNSNGFIPRYDYLLSPDLFALIVRIVNSSILRSELFRVLIDMLPDSVVVDIEDAINRK